MPWPSARRWSSVAIAVGMLAGCSAAGAASADAAALRGLGVSRIGDGALNADLDRAKAVGADVVRVELLWRRLEPNAPGQYDTQELAAADAAFARARSRGLKIILNVDGTPCWASSAADELRQGCGSGADREVVGRYPPADPAAFAAVTRFIVGRYAKDLAAYEVWNEPDLNTEAYFAGPDKTTRYAALLRSAYPAAKQAAPGVPVLGASIVGSNGLFLQALYDAGIKGYYDGLSVHFYDLVLSSLRAIRGTQRKNGDSTPLWLNEFGWSSCYPRQQTQIGHNCVTAAMQGRNLVDIFAALRKGSYVKAAVVYTLNDTLDSDFGLLTRGGGQKPAYAALRSAWHGTPKRAPVRLTVRGSGGAAVASGSGPAGDIFRLTLRRGGQPRGNLTFRLDRSGHYRLALAGARRGDRVRVSQVWTGAAAGGRVR